MKPQGTDRASPYAAKKFIEIEGHRIAYTDEGEGAPILFLHGNPTSSYLWRNVLPEVEGLGRLIAPDLIGMGDSDKLPDPGASTYRYKIHRDFLWAFIDAVVGREPLTLVVHDWGSALGFEWAMQHQDRIAGIAYMEALVRPIADWNEFPESATEIFRQIRTAAGEELVLNHNVFVEQVLPSLVIRPLLAEEMNEYRRPFSTHDDRWPTLAWPREIPVGGEPADVTAMMNAYGAWLSASNIPKLFINAEPGIVLSGLSRDFCRTWPNQTEVTVPGVHFVQEDSGPEIGRAVGDWIRNFRSR
jgi:haloalkane dehalogenase